MSKPIEMIDNSTGEVIDDWHIQLVDNCVDDSRVRMRALVHGKTIQPKDIGYWEINDTNLQDNPEMLDDARNGDEFGYMEQLDDRRKFTKSYQTAMPKFTKDRMYKYWIHIEKSLECNTGIICDRDSGGKVYRIQTYADWQEFLDAGRSSVAEFLVECKAKMYLAIIETASYRWYMVNPHFCWNGRMIPKAIQSIFRFKADDGGCISQSAITDWVKVEFT